MLLKTKLKNNKKKEHIKKKKKNIIINNKCLVKKSTLKPLPLSYFKNTGNTIFNNFVTLSR